MLLLALELANSRCGRRVDQSSGTPAVKRGLPRFGHKHQFKCADARATSPFQFQSELELPRIVRSCGLSGIGEQLINVGDVELVGDIENVH